MDEQLHPILSYASPERRLPRFRPLLTFFPFVGGMVIGDLLGIAFTWSRPPVPLWPESFEIWLLVFQAIFIAAIGYTLVVLFIRCCLSSNVLTTFRWTDVLMFGAILPVLIIGVGDLIQIATWRSSDGEHLVDRGLALVVVAAGVTFLTIPFFLLGAAKPESEPVQGRSARPRTLPGLLLLLLLASAAISAGQWIELWWFDRNCARLADWIRATYPVPAPHPSLALPEQFQRMSFDRAVDAVVLRDGRVVLMLKTAAESREEWSGVLYSSGPILPSEYGKSDFAGPCVAIPGVPAHYIMRTRDNCHFVVKHPGPY